MTPTHCSAQLRRLSVLRGIPEDVVEYFAALDDIPDAVFTSAVSHALKTRQWFPTPAELRADCDAVHVPLPEGPLQGAAVSHLPDLILTNPFSGKVYRIRVTRIWKFDCEVCVDTGWATKHCPEDYCGNKKWSDHYPHDWLVPCACRPTNPTLRRRRAANAKYAQPPEKVGA